MHGTKIIILNWNGEGHLARFLPGVVAAAPEGVGVVVADNGSTDGSLALLARDFPQVQVVRLDRNYGFAEGYNRALAHVEAEYFVLLNSDVETPAGWLEPLIETLERNAGASGGFIDYLGYPFCRGRILRNIECDRGQYDDGRDVFWASGAAFCCRASVLRELGGFDAGFFAHLEEIDLCWRMQLRGYRIRVVPRSRVYHLGGGTLAAGSASKVYYNHRNNLAMLFKCAPPLQRAVVAVVRPPLDLCAALSSLAQGRGDLFRAVGRAWRDFIRMHPSLARERRSVRGGRVAEARGIYRGSVVLRYLLGRRRFDKMM